MQQPALQRSDPLIPEVENKPRKAGLLAYDTPEGQRYALNTPLPSSWHNQ